MKCVYDIEIYPNFWLVVFLDVDDESIYTFELSDRMDQRSELFAFLRQLTLLIGFNNLLFDSPVIDKAIKLIGQGVATSVFNAHVWSEVGRIINSKTPWFNKVREPFCEQLDLYLIHHFNNKARRTSLKSLQFVMKMDLVQELPIEVGTILDVHQMDDVVSYCINDVEATYKFYLESTEEIQLRTHLSRKYEMDMMNYNATKMGQEIFRKIIREKMGFESIGKTPRETINLNDIIFDYIEYESDEFNLIKGWLQQQVITETKGTFSKIDFDSLHGLTGYYHVDRTVGCQRNLNVMYHGLKYVFGLGGIHASREGIFKADYDWTIIDLDVASYYPNLAIKNKLFPEHLSEGFCNIYEGVYYERKQYPKKTPSNLALKLALNGVYGKSNEEFSIFYDPKYTMSITVNGQLLLCKLAEMLMLACPDACIIQVNTDGLTIRVRRGEVDLVEQVKNQWESLTDLELEQAIYTAMYIADVNNYIAVYEDGGVKRKGRFEYKRGYHQNHSALIVPKCLEAYFVNDIPVETFIYNHDNPYDFMLRTNLTGKSKLIGRSENGEEVSFPKLTRYVVSTHGCTLIKVMPPLKGKTKIREFNIEAGYKCIVLNDLRGISDTHISGYMINYEYYINKVKQEITKIRNATAEFTNV